LVTRKVAVTDLAALIVTVQVSPLLESQPAQLPKSEPDIGEAVNVTGVPLVKLALHVAPQSMPAGLLLTVPLPAPVFATVNAKVVGGARLNVAVALFAASIVTTQVSMPVQAPLHPANVEPVAGTAVSITWVPLATLSAQSAPQSIPPGLLVTVPEPVPALDMVRLNVSSANVAVTDFAASIVTTQGPVALVQAPAHPAKVEPAVGSADSVTVRLLA
jgi:hypothetical protein